MSQKYDKIAEQCAHDSPLQNATFFHPTANHHVSQKLPGLSKTPRRLLVEFADDPRYLLMSKDVGFGSKLLYSRCYRFSQKMILLQVQHGITLKAHGCFAVQMCSRRLKWKEQVKMKARFSWQIHVESKFFFLPEFWIVKIAEERRFSRWMYLQILDGCNHFPLLFVR